jgi:hypothetical protein
MKPDTSLATKSGHFYLLTTLPGWPQTDRDSWNAAERLDERIALYAPIEIPRQQD